jgi:hypothetical protein
MNRILLRMVARAAAVVVALPAGADSQAAPQLRRLADIGCADCGDARELSSTWDVAVTERGDVLVVDRDAPMLRLFDRTGRLVWGRGRPGAGPGEYRFPMRAAIGPDGSIEVVDPRLRRLTRLAADGVVKQSLVVPFFPAAIAARGRAGELVILTDDFRGHATLERWLPADSAPVRVASLEAPARGGVASGSPSVAVAPSGDLAYIVSADRYEIHRLSASGQALPSIVRDIPRPRRTPEEIAAVRRQIAMVGAAMKAQERARSGQSRPVMPGDDALQFKPHASTDALRYDDGGRLWVRTMRATGQATVFDVFAPDGQFVGEVTVPLAVHAYSLAGDYLATAGEREDGTPVVVLWAVR